MTAPQLKLKDVLLSLYDRDAEQILRYVHALTGDLTEDELNWQPRPGHHSLWHNLWHMFLCQDYFRAITFDKPAVWEAGNWRSRIDLTAMARAFDYPGLANGVNPRFAIADVPDTLVDELKAAPLAQYLAYVEEMQACWRTVLEQLPEGDLDRQVFANSLTTRVAERAVGSGHIYRHIGMMEDLRGLLRGPSNGSATS